MNENHDKYSGPERRRCLTNGEIEEIKKQLLDSIYADIGKNVVTKILWVGGTVLTALLAYLSVTGHIKIG